MPAVARQNERAVAATSPAPVQNLEARSMQEIVEAIRVWRDMRGVSLATLDHIAGWADGYGAKLLAPSPIKNLGWESIGLGLNALAIKLVVVEDPEQRKLVERRWIPRERPRNAAPAAGKGRRHTDH
jgi:hypothetical protein